MWWYITIIYNYYVMIHHYYIQLLCDDTFWPEQEIHMMVWSHHHGSHTPNSHSIPIQEHIQSLTGHVFRSYCPRADHQIRGSWGAAIDEEPSTMKRRESGTAVLSCCSAGPCTDIVRASGSSKVTSQSQQARMCYYNDDRFSLVRDTFTIIFI